MEWAEKIELHYYFSDASHSMNAVVKNRCEAEFLAVALDIAETLGIQLDLDSEALLEGGIREIWQAIGENSAQIALLISTLALIWSVIPNTDQELVDLQKEDTRLSIEQRKLEIEKLQEEMEKEEINTESVERAARVASESYKVATRKSNFYKILYNYEKVTQVGYRELDSGNNSIADESVVEREYFSRFILISHDLEPIRDSSARIEIVAPVLTDGKAKWKGVYDGQSISFAMNDKEFKRAVLSKQLSFKNGDEILCVLLVHKKVDELGEVITSGYSVDVVLENIHSGTSNETTQGRQYRHAKKMVDGQGDMFDPDNA